MTMNEDNSYITATATPRVVSEVTNTVLNHTPLTPVRAYYRSKIGTFHSSSNLLLNAAANLLVFANYLAETNTPINAAHLYSELIHEVRAFETAAQQAGYRSEIILVARYILCALLDETLLANPHTEQIWEKYALLAVLHGETQNSSRFFLILERLSADPKLNIDILELIYLCLNLGLRERQAQQENETAKLQATTENLYQLIRWQRGDISKQLVITEAVNTPAMQRTKKEFRLSFKGFMLFLAASFLVIYLGFNFILDSALHPIYQQLNSLLQNNGKY